MWIEQNELDTKLHQAENKGWTKAIEAVRAQLKGRLLGAELGGDIDINDTVDKLIQRGVFGAVTIIKKQYDARTL